MQHAVLVIFQDPGGNILLGQRRGYLTMPGGTLEQGQDFAERALLYSFQQTGLIPSLAGPVGHVISHQPGNRTRLTAIYLVKGWSGQLHPTTDFQGEWIAAAEIEGLYNRMRGGYRLWLGMALSDQRFLIELWYDANGSVERYDLKWPKQAA